MRMNNITAELKIMIASVVTSIIIDAETFIRFIVPLMSAATWYFLKLILDEMRVRRRIKKELEKQRKEEENETNNKNT